MDKALVNEAVMFMAYDQATEAADPGNGAFDFPAAAVAAKLAAILGGGSNAASSVRTD